MIPLLIVIGRLFFIQVVQHDFWMEKAMNQWSAGSRIERQRGTIYDRHGHELAISIRMHSLAANPGKFADDADRAAAARRLAPILHLDREVVAQRLARPGAFTWIARKLNDDAANRIRALKIDGLIFRTEYKRFYPHDSTAAHVLGFVGMDDEGLEGVEKAQNEILRGPAVLGDFIRDAAGNPVPVDGVIRYPQFDGKSVYLTIDLVVQSSLEQALFAAAREFNAKSASGVVIDPQTGEILALANFPTYDLNHVTTSDADSRRNRALTDVFEPGSTFKIFSGALALAGGQVRPEDQFYCPGSLQVAGYTVKCHAAHGQIDYRRAIEASCNVAAMLVAQRLNPAVLYEGLRAYGFGARTGIDLPGEVAGVLRPVDGWSKLSQSMLSLGQEISVSTLQLVMATGAMANGGRLLVPHIINGIRDKDGQPVAAFPPQMRAHPVDPSTSRIMGQIMNGGVLRGTGIKAAITGFTVSGKTGTGQISGPQGGYIKGRYNAVFIGWTPTDAPVLAMAIVVHDPDPSKGYYGGQVAAPIFSRVGTEVMRYLRVGAGALRDTATMRSTPPSTPRHVGGVRGGKVDVPDLIGMSLREARELMVSLPLNFQPNGSGVATSQSVPAGTLLPIDAPLKAQFSPPIGASNPATLADIAPE